MAESLSSVWVEQDLLEIKAWAVSARLRARCISRAPCYSADYKQSIDQSSACVLAEKGYWSLVVAERVREFEAGKGYVHEAISIDPVQKHITWCT